MYEYLLKNLTTAGKNGQFRTPRHIIRMMVKLVDPKLGERICDPAAGTAGFLCNSYEHILEMNTSPDVLEYDEEGKPHHLIGDKIADKKLMNFLKNQALTGYDFDTTMTRIGAMNLMLHGIDNPNFRYSDTLAKAFTEKGMYDVILANPPFKGSIDKSDINERFKTKTTKTELLFVELIYDMLVTGGRAGVIVPDGVLFGSSNAHKSIRKTLLEKCRLEGVISMPSGVFKPYAGVSTAVLIFQKVGDPAGSGSSNTDKVWFYDMQADGFSLDDKRDKIEKNDIPDIIEKWKSKDSPAIDSSLEGGLGGDPLEGRRLDSSRGKGDETLGRGDDRLERGKGGEPAKNSPLEGGSGGDRKQKHFFVPVSEIIENNYDLSINRYKEIEYETTRFENSGEIIKLIKINEEIIQKKLNELESLKI